MVRKKLNKLFSLPFKIIKINLILNFFGLLILLFSVNLFAEDKTKSTKIDDELPTDFYSNKGLEEVEKKMSNWTLEQIEKYAVNNNPLYNAEKQNINLAIGDLMTAKLNRNPVLGYQQQFIPLRVSDSITASGPFAGTTGAGFQVFRQSLPGGAGGQPELAPSLSWEYDFGVIRNQKTKVAQQGIKFEKAKFSDFDRVFRLRLRQYYWLHKYLTEYVNFQKEFYENYNELLDLTKFRAEKGDISLLEYDRLTLERIRIEKEYKEAEIMRAQAAKDLRFFIGIAPSNQALLFNGKLEFYSLKELGLDLKNYNIENRADLQALKSKAIQNKLTIELKEKEVKVPYVNFGGEVRLKGNEQYAGIFASIPLKIEDRNQGEIYKAQETFKKSQLEVESKTKQIYSEIRAALREILSREELLKEYKSIKLIDKNKTVQEKYRLAYIRGASNLVTFLEAEKNYLSVLRGYYEQLYLYYNAIEGFRAAIGKLGENE